MTSRHGARPTIFFDLFDRRIQYRFDIKCFARHRWNHSGSSTFRRMKQVHYRKTEEYVMKKLTTGFLIAIAALSLSACNTLRGAGQDVEDAGEAVQDAAD
jgi:predicted small secreted protein